MPLNVSWKKEHQAFGKRPMAMTIDVEDYFQVGAFFDCVKPEDWPKFELRVRTSTQKLLELYDEKGVKATFFILGWIAQQCPELVREIYAAGHEVASHGFSHQRVCEMDQRAFIEDTRKSIVLLEDIMGEKVNGYRAPCFSINTRTPWAFDALSNMGIKYSSSTYPIKHDHYGTPNWPATPFIANDAGILELPQSVVNIRGRNIPAGGGGYFRLFPMGINKWLIKKFHEQQSHPYIFYCHPWEIDHEQPKIKGASFKSLFRHHVNQQKMLGKIEALCDMGSWQRLDSLYESIIKRDAITSPRQEMRA